MRHRGGLRCVAAYMYDCSRKLSLLALCMRVPGVMTLCAPGLRRAVVVVILCRHRDTSLFVLSSSVVIHRRSSSPTPSPVLSSRHHRRRRLYGCRNIPTAIIVIVIIVLTVVAITIVHSARPVTVVPTWHELRLVVQPSFPHTALCRPPLFKLAGILRPAAPMPRLLIIRMLLRHASRVHPVSIYMPPQLPFCRIHHQVPATVSYCTR